MFCPECNKKFSDFETICPTCLAELKDEFLTGSSPVSKVTPISDEKETRHLPYSVRKQPETTPYPEISPYNVTPPVQNNNIVGISIAIVAAVVILFITSTVIPFILTKYKEASSIQESKEHKNKALNYYRNKQYREAITEYEKAIEKDPNDSVSYNDLADCHYYLSEYGKAKDYYSKSLSLDPNNYESLYYTGNSLYYEGNYKEALIYYSKSIDKTGFPYDCYDAMAMCYYNMKDYKSARDYAQKAIALAP